MGFLPWPGDCYDLYGHAIRMICDGSLDMWCLKERCCGSLVIRDVVAHYSVVIRDVVAHF